MNTLCARGTRPFPPPQPEPHPHSTSPEFVRRDAAQISSSQETFPHALKAQAARRAELHAKLDRALRKALAAQGIDDPHTHGIYRRAFPNESAIAMYVRRTAKRVEEEKNARVAEFGERFRQRAGVD